ncbi:MAG: DUF1919 domain-containing protein [Erysipelotrichaceae bacterium]
MILYLKKKIRVILRIKINKRNRKRLKNKECSILASNCVGGVIYHELGIKFLSPTINIYFDAPDFIKFLKDPKKYCNPEQMVLIKQNIRPYPVVKINDITIYCVHYQTFEEVKHKWVERFSRIKWDNLCIIMSERDKCTYDDIVEFDKLSYENKVIFVHKEMPEIKSSIYISGTELDGKDGNWIRSLTDYLGSFTGKRIMDLWDYVDFINNARNGKE